ncbi:MAG: outer membrane protein assembly factor [Chromatiales bacterium]|nr:outer membrane protein assembly factor [Chromatiales bacterium]
MVRLRIGSFLLLIAVALVAAAAEPRVDVEGIDGERAENVRLLLRMLREPCKASRARLESQLKTVDSDVSRALRPFGFYSAKVVEKKLLFGGDCWGLRLRVAPGPRVQLEKVDLRLDGTAKDDEAFAKLLRTLPLKRGQALRHADYESAKTALSGLAAERGYHDAHFTVSRLLVNPGSQTAEAVLHFDSGPRYRFGKISFNQDAFEPTFIGRFLPFDSGTPYDAARVGELQRALSDSQLFDSVEVRPHFDQAVDALVPVDVNLQPRKRHAYRIGIGASTDQGPRVRLEYQNRRINRWGHTGSASLLLSTVDSELSLRYGIPLEDPRHEQVNLQAGVKYENSDTARYTSYNLAANYTRSWDDGWRFVSYLELSREDFEVGEDQGITTLLTPGVIIGRVRSDGGLRPRRGYQFQFELKGASKALLSDLDFVQARLSGKYIMPLGNGRLLSRADFGYTVGDELSLLPVSQRFFAGGDRSVRGYDYQALGPEDDNGDVVGGRYLIVGSLEYEHPITEQWSVAAFVDVGNALDRIQDPLETSAGLGVRWFSPLGPIRLDLAHAFNDDEPVVRLHFSLGPDL